MNIVNLIKKAAVGVLSTGTTVLIAACYGPMDEYYKMSDGYVRDHGDPVPDIQVCIETQAGQACGNTYSDCSYWIETMDYNIYDSAQASGFQICVTDIDGPANGEYEKTCVPFNPGEVPANGVEIQPTPVVK